MQPRKIFIPEECSHLSPFFYIIRHKPSGRLYGGIKYSKKKYAKCDSSKFMTKFGYQTSSEYVKEIINSEGLDSFEIDRIKHFKTPEEVRKYEKKFLTKVNAAGHENFLNKSNGGGENYVNSLESIEKARLKRIGGRRSDETKLKMSKAQMGRALGRKASDETKLKMSLARKGKPKGPMSEEAKANMKLGAKNRPPLKDHVRLGLQTMGIGRSWYNDGTNNKFCYESPGDNWIPGMLFKARGNKPGYKYWNNGVIVKRSKTKPEGDEWVLGNPLRKKAKPRSNVGVKWWHNGKGTTKQSIESPGDEWILGRR